MSEHEQIDPPVTRKLGGVPRADPKTSVSRDVG
jgi:hypothetical protein